MVPHFWDMQQKDRSLMNMQSRPQAGERRFMSITEWLRLKGPLEALSSNLSTQAGPPRAACPGFWVSPRTVTPQPSWATCASTQSLWARLINFPGGNLFRTSCFFLGSCRPSSMGSQGWNLAPLEKYSSSTSDFDHVQNLAAYPKNLNCHFWKYMSHAKIDKDLWTAQQIFFQISIHNYPATQWTWALWHSGRDSGYQNLSLFLI